MLLNLYLSVGFCGLVAYILLKTIFNTDSKTAKKWLYGPTYIPLIGGGLQVAAFASIYSLNDTLTQLCKRYGSICGVWGSRNNYFVFVNDAQNARKILKDENFDGKFPQPAWDSLVYGKPNLGILHSYGSTTKELRQRSIMYLKKYGWGSININAVLNSLVEKSLNRLETRRQESKDNVLLIEKYTFLEDLSDLLWKVLIGSPFPGDEGDFKSIVDAAEISLNTSVKGFAILFAYKFLRFIPGLTVFNTMNKSFRKTERLIKEVIKKRRQSGKYKENQDSFLDSFLLDVDQHVHPDVTDEQLVWVINDLQLVGTTGLHTYSLHWALLYLVLHPEVLHKVADEIDIVIGKSRQPALEDRVRMPYTEAVILETIRMGNVVCYAMRANSKDVVFDGYFIPKDSLVMVDTECLRKDPTVWPDPNIYRPARFYDEETNSLVNVEKLNAFGYKRPCLGEQIVKQSNFIFLTSILQKYDISRCKNLPLPSMQSKSGIIGRPESFYVKFVPKP